MTSNQKNVVVFSIVFAAFSLPAWLYLEQHAWNEDSLGQTLRIGARLALLIYLAIFIARPLRDLTANAVSTGLVRNRRLLGIAFTAIMTAHLYLLITLNGLPAANAGMIVYAFIYLMLITSFNKPAAALGPKHWKILHKAGLYVIGIALAQAQFKRLSPDADEAIHYVLAALILVAIGIRFAAWRRKRT